MVDNVAILPPGWRALDNNGDLITDGILAFFTAGTTTPVAVYSDSALTISLGTSVACNSAGYPVTGANAKTLIYTGIDSYKIRLTSAIFGGTVFEHDNVSGALNTTGFLTSSFTPSKFIVAEPNDRAVGAADKGKLIDVDCSAGAKTMTIGDATILGNNWWCGIRHNGSANQVKIIGDGADLFSLNSVNVTAFSLTGRGQVVYMICDGTGFKIDGQVPPLIGGTIGVIVIADRLSTPPVSPIAGARYIVTASPLGAWSTFAQHDIAEATGQGTWFKYTPFADCGWTAFVQDEDVNYQFRGSAWAAGLSIVPTVQRFTSGVAATYTPPAGVSSIRVRMVGGGGGGGAVATNAGAAGETTSFGGWTAINGAGGANGAAALGGGVGGTGGADGTGTLIARFAGGNGSHGGSTAGVPIFGVGGQNPFGGGGTYGETSAGVAAKANTGGGGGAGCALAGNSGSGGGAGEYVEFFVAAPGATTYTVGAGGAGGAAGTFAGGAGAAGIIIVEEFY